MELHDHRKPSLFDQGEGGGEGVGIQVMMMMMLTDWLSRVHFVLIFKPVIIIRLWTVFIKSVEQNVLGK